MRKYREKFGSDGKCSRITKRPQRPRIFQPGKILNRFQDRQRLRKKTVKEPSASSNIFQLWKWEVFSCVLAIGTLGSMYGILQHYDGHRIPDWGTAINLSTLIALMATLLRNMLVFVVAEIIGQAKWNYFAGVGTPAEDPPMRRLIETNRFNDASQGLIGAFKLLPTVFRDPATLLAIMVMVVSFGMGSFVQQAIRTQSCQFPMDSVNASLPISRNITTGNGKATESGTSMFGPLDNPNVLAALSSSLAPDSEEMGSPIDVGCPTGNCTFQSSISGIYHTLGVCSSCADTSSLISSAEWTSTVDEPAWECVVDSACKYYSAIGRGYFWTNHTLPNGMAVHSSFNNASSVVYNGLGQTTELSISASRNLGLAWAGDLVSLEMMALSQWAFANVTILTSNWLPTGFGFTDYVAATCKLYPCLRSYNASVTLGKLDEVFISTTPVVPNVAALFVPQTTAEAIRQELTGYDWYDYIVYSPGANFQAVQSPCFVNDTIWTKANQSSTLEMQRLLLLHADPDPSGTRHFTVENTTAPADCVYGLDVMAVEELSRLMSGVSFNGSCSAESSFDSPKNTIRIDCGQAYWLAKFYSDDGATADSIIQRIETFTDRLSNKMRMGLLNDPEAVSGQVLQVTACSIIHYSWLTFPAVLVAVTSGLLAWTMLQSSRRQGLEMVWKTSILPFIFHGDRFVVQNGEDVSAYSAEALQRRGPQEPLLDLDRMEVEARQQVVRFNAFE